jgi:hypothetical protein
MGVTNVNYFFPQQISSRFPQTPILLEANVKGVNLPIIGNFHIVPPRSASSHVSVRIASMNYQLGS